jgi:hypothetical protein
MCSNPSSCFQCASGYTYIQHLHLLQLMYSINL